MPIAFGAMRRQAALVLMPRQHLSGCLRSGLSPAPASGRSQSPVSGRFMVSPRHGVRTANVAPLFGLR
jgi:hypothetical protein